MVFYSPFSFGADDRTLFRSLLIFLLLILLAYNLIHSDFALLAIADGVANSRFIGCLVALFFLQVLITVYNVTSRPFKSCFGVP